MELVREWKHRFRFKWVIFLSAVTLSTVILGGYALQSTTTPLEVKEPLEILNYPSALSFFPGQTIDFNITIKNSAPVTYNISLDFTLNDTVYQAKYVTYSKNIYAVASGEANLAAWLKISISAPTAQLTLTVNANRGSQLSPQPTSPTFSPSLTLLGAGARTSVLYVDWCDNFNAHYYTDGASWGPW